jgi:hypothetical protein
MSDPDKPILRSPTRQELATLPPRAIVAFAARCARRVLPLYRFKCGAWPPAPFRAAVASAVYRAEEFGAVGKCESHDVQVAAQLAWAAQDVERRPRDADYDPSGHRGKLFDAATCAAQAAVAAVDAAIVAAGPEYSRARVADLAAVANEKANVAAETAGYQNDPDAHVATAYHAAAYDFNTLRHHLGSAVTEETSVTPAFFGPLWPRGAPVQWHSNEAYESTYEPAESGAAASAILSMNLTDLNLSPRIAQCLRHLRLNTLGDLIERTADELLEAPDFGPKSLIALRRALGRFHLKLRGD